MSARTRVVGIVVATAATISVGAAAAGAKTVWLCMPGRSPDPCAPGLSTTVYSPTLKRVRVESPKAVARPAIDCFYVYPTVSGQRAGNANLQIQTAESAVATTQAARYSQYCRVFAPMYRQVTLAGIGGSATTTPNPALALAGVRSAFADYLRHFNHRRGFVLIGHSQGSFMLRQLIARDVDSRPAVRRLLVSAILLGGNVLVKRGSDVGGDFRHVRACRSAAQLECVIAFSTFDRPVPNPSLFGRPLPILGTTVRPGEAVLCTNPAALGGGAGLLDPIFPRGGISQLGRVVQAPKTVWSTAPRSYRARCSSADDANVLQISPVGGAVAPASPLPPVWGLHLLDANIALGNLISIVKTEAGAFRAKSR